MGTTSNVNKFTIQHQLIYASKLPNQAKYAMATSFELAL